MTSKGFTNTLKLAPIYACGRQVVDLMEKKLPKEKDALIDFKVSGEDMKAAWEFVKLSLNTFKSFKVCLVKTNLINYLTLFLYFSFPLLKS